MHCSYCKKLIKRTKKKKFILINKTLQKKQRIFCSKQCYEGWKRSIYVPNTNSYYIWIIKSLINNKIIFRRKKIILKGISDIYGSNKKNSHFSNNIFLN